MLKQFVLTILTCALVLFAGVSRALAQEPELYLSYEQRLAITYAMAAHGEPEAVQQEYLRRAVDYFKGVASKPIETVKVRNFEEFLNHFRGQWPNTQSVSLDLQSIEQTGPRAMAVYKCDSPRIQKKIEQYLNWQLQQMKQMAESEPLAQKYFQSKEMVGAGLMLLQNQNVRELAKGFILKESNSVFDGKMKEFDRIGEKIASSHLAQSSDATMRIILQTMFTEYFSRLSADSKKMIVSSYLGDNLNADDMQKFEIMVQNAGPQLQKLLQIVARQGDMGPEMTKIFKTLEDAVRPVPWQQVEKIIQAEAGNYEFIYFERKPLGVGTMAQVHRAKILVNGERRDVVVRFIKPGIEKRVEEDGRILKEVAAILDADPVFAKTGAPKLTPIVADVTATVTAELSQEDTIARQKMAKSVYEQTVLMKTKDYKNYIEFHVPDIYPARNNAKSRFMVQEMVIGKKLDKEADTWKDLVPELKKAVTEALAQIWGNEVLFKTGFYHSDLHQGNFMVRLTDEKIRVNILDFGMGGVISRDLQNAVMILGAGAELKNTDLVSRAFWQISNKATNQITEQQLKALVSERMKQNFTDPQETTLDGWTKWIMNHGLRLPYEFISLNRGIVIVNKLLMDSGSTMSIAGLIKSYALKNPVEVYRRLVVEEKLSRIDVMKLGISEILTAAGLKAPSADAAPVIQKPAGALRCEAVFQ